MTYLVFDTETTIKEMYGRTANPFYNHVVCVAKKPEGQNARGWLIYEGGDVDIDGLYDADLLIGHNIKFDLLYIWDMPYFQDWLLAGGTIWDTQLAEFILSGQRHKFAGLRDIAANRYGCPFREKVMEPYWEKGICTSKIPPEIVLNDCINDVLDTEQVYLGQLDRAYRQHMSSLIKSQNEALLATTEMEFNGMKIDLEILRQNRQQEQESLIQKEEILRQEIQKILPEDLL